MSEKLCPAVKHMAVAAHSKHNRDHLFLVIKGWSQPWLLVDRILRKRMGKRDLLLKGRVHTVSKRVRARRCTVTRISVLRLSRNSLLILRML